MSGARARFVTDFLGPEHDREAGPGSDRPTRSYVVCSTPRSGSGLLCRALAGIGGLGIPLEYFNPIHRATFTERWRCAPGLQPYVDALHARRTSPDGVFAAKLHWDQMVQLRAEASAGTDDRFDHRTSDAPFDRVFPAARFIRIVRLDLDRQAVSYWRAMSSNVWSIGAEDPAEPTGEETPYDFEGIDRCRRLIENGELCWERLIRARGADALVATYEQLSDDLATTVARVTQHIALGVTCTVPPSSTRRMSDDHSLELLERFRHERASRGDAGA